MTDENLLLVFGFSATILPILFVVSRFISGRAHLCTSLNATLAGYVPFVGLSTIAFANQSGHVQIPYANYQTDDIYRMIAAVIIFTAALLFTYNHFRPNASLNAFLTKQPGYTPWQATAVSAIGLLLTMACMLPRFGIYVPVLGELLVKSMSASVIFAALFSFASWWRDRGNLPAFWAFVAVFSSCVILAVLTGGGRRAILGVVLSAGVYAYWKNYKNLDRIKIVFYGGVFVILAFLFMTAYNQVRHFDRSGSRVKERNVANAINALMQIPSKLSHIDLTDDQIISDIGQNATNCSLYSIHLSQRLKRTGRTRELRYPSYFHTLLFVASNPIPRRYWESKPLTLGYLLPKQYARNAQVNWGPGLAGHFYHEGGLALALFYGYLMGIVLKQIDAIVVTTPQSLFSIAFISSTIPQLVCFVRGDMAIILLNLVFCFVVFLAMKYICFKMYGRATRLSAM